MKQNNIFTMIFFSSKIINEPAIYSVKCIIQNYSELQIKENELVLIINLYQST